jgi:Uma2 family endonuclease
MQTVIFKDESVLHIPNGISDLAAFRRWAHSDQFPEKGRICYLDGEVWVDMSPEQVFSHILVKTEFAAVLSTLAKKNSAGTYFSDGLLLTNSAANLTCKPDGTFISNRSFKDKSVHFVAAKSKGYLELEGTPDMVLEVVSASSVEKDTEILRELYWRAEILEYWLVDARSEILEFDIFRRTTDGYVAARKQLGWVKSRVFGGSFRFTCGMDDFGNPTYTLSIR